MLLESTQANYPPMQIPLLYELTQAVAAAKNLDEIYEAALDCLEASIGGERSSILLFDDTNVMRFVAWRGLSPEYRAAVDGHSPWDLNTRDAAPLLIPDVALDTSLGGLLPAIEAEGIRALAFVPLSVAGRLLGKFMLYFDAPHPFPWEEVMVAQTIGAQVAFAIEQHQASDERQFHADILAGQKRTLELLVSGAPLATVLDAVVGAVQDLTPDRSPSTIMLLDDEQKLQTVAARGLPEHYLAAINGLKADARVGTCCAAAATGVPVVTPDFATDPGWDGLSHLPLALGLRGAWSQPIVARNGEVLGTLGSYFRERREPSIREHEAVELLARTAAIAIERDRARQEQRAERARLEAMFRSAVSGIAHVGADGIFIEVNDRYCEMTGRTREELVGKLDCFAVTHPDDCPELHEHMDALRAGDSHFTSECRIVRPDWSAIWVSSNASALRDQSGALTGAVAIATDVTERHVAEGIIRNSEQRYRELLEAIGLAVYTTDAEGRINLYNDAAVELWGRTPELGVDMWCGSYRIFDLEGEPVPLEDCPMGVALRENRAVRGEEIVVERPDGTRANVMPYPTPLRNSAGVLTGAVNVLVDITPLKSAQADLEEALLAKDDFLGQVSHELRTPLTQLVGNAEILIRRWQELGDETRNESLEAIHSQALRLERLIDNMLVLSRAERGIAGDVEPQLVQRLLVKTAEEFAKRYPRTVLKVDIDPHLPPVETSTSTIDQVVWNLLTNAHKYGNPGGPVTLRASSTAVGTVEISVKDEGAGISDEDFDQLFLPYFRSSVTADVAGGLGLGLSVCKRLIEAQNGEMWAIRREPQGMEFGVRLRASPD